MTTTATNHDSDRGAPQVALMQTPGFWIVVGYAVLFGVVLAVASLAFLTLMRVLTNLWFTLPADLGWFGGSPWWVVVTAGAGLLVGVLRRAFRLPERLPGTVEELRTQRVEPSTVLGSVAVSLVSLGGGASLGPEEALGKMGGGLGTWISDRRKLGEDLRATNTLSGMSAAYGGMLSSPILGSILTLEIGHPSGARFADALVGSLLAASVSFAVYFPIAGSTFVGLYDLPPYQFEDWHMLAAIPLGLVAGGLALVTVVAIGLMKRLTAPLARFTILRPVMGGIAFGLVGVALPLTLFTGTDQLTTVINDGAALGAGLLIAIFDREDPRLRDLRGDRLHRRAVPRDAVHRRHGWGDGTRVDPGTAGGPRVHGDVRSPAGGARPSPLLADLPRRPDDPGGHTASRPSRSRCSPHTSPSRGQARSWQSRDGADRRTQAGLSRVHAAPSVPRKSESTIVAKAVR